MDKIIKKDRNKEHLEKEWERMTEQLKEKSKITHQNGYSAILYGEKSMSIYNPEGREVLHTFSRNANTEEEVLEHLETMPEFLEMLGIEVDTSEDN